jgi:hypothetical protein
MRSAGFHRHHPVIPGQPQVQTPCRRCKKKAKREREKRDAKGSGSGTIRIEIDDGRERGRARSRKMVYVARRRSSPSPLHTRVRSTSRTRIGVRVLQQSRSPPEVLRRRRTEVRVSSSSPPANVRFRRHRSDEVYSTRDMHDAYPLRRRVTELSPSPPPLARTRTTTRVEYRNEFPEPRPTEHRRHSPSPVRVGRRDRRTDDAHSQLAAHPAAYRTVEVVRPTLRDSEGSVSIDCRELSPPPRGILRHPDIDYRTSHRRRMEASHDSMLPEPGGSRVQFAGEPRRVERREVDYRREHYKQQDARREYVDDIPLPSLSPPIERSFERLRVRPTSPPSPEAYKDEVRVRHVSPRRYEEVRVRRTSPAPRGRPETRREPSPRATSYTRYHSIERMRSVSPPPPDPRHEDWEDVTESDSENESAPEGELVSVRRYHGLDEHGRPVTFVEETRTRYVGGEAPPLGERTFPTTPAITRGYAPV